MTDTAETSTEGPAVSPAKPAKPKPKRRKARPRRAAAPKSKPAAKPDSEFPGLSPTTCCADCSPEKGCVITQGGTGFCAHPLKGGLQQSDALKHEVVARFGRAKKALAHSRIDKN